MKSWKTTIGGVALAVGTALVGAELSGQIDLPQWLLIASIVLQAGGGALIGFNARDNSVTSERAGAR